MTCPACATANPDAAKFCMSCGTLLQRRCPSCSAEVPDAAKFCLACGHKLDTAPAAPAAPGGESRLDRYIPPELLAKLESSRAEGGMQGERRVVTILFCDVKGSTAAAEQLDPEEWAEIMNGAFEHLIAPVYRYEGTLARLMGDAVLAFFGAPIGHEDDPERAVLAGLDIVREIRPYADRVKLEWGIDFDVRVGINTGLVVVGEFGSDMRLEYTAMGDAVNMASRMEQTAQPGTVQVSGATFKHIAPLFEVEDRGRLEVKGKAEPVAAYRVLGRKQEPGRLRGVEGLDSPMVGRDAELAVLRGRIDAVRRGSGQVVSVMGEAGLGKSRLVAETLRSVRDDGLLDGIGWHEGRSLSYQTATPYAPVADLLSGILGLDRDAAPDRRRAALQDAVTAAAGDAAPRILPYLASLLGLPLAEDEIEKVKYLEPADLARHIRNAVVAVTGYLCQERPRVLVLEDLHWADSRSLDVVEGLLAVAERAPLMLLLVFRARHQEPSWRIHETAARELAHRYTPLTLEPLDEAGSRRLVANLLRIEGLPESLRALILEKAEGNPFYVEEVIRTLLDTGVVVREGDRFVATEEVGEIRVPDSLAAVLTARLDSLDDASRRVAQTASVLGRAFQFDTLASIYEPLDALEAALTDLQRRGLVREKARVPQRLYAFKHVLTQETAYASMLLKDRRTLHGRVADVLTRIDPDAVQDIARHYLEARQATAALPYLVEAGERAAHAYSIPEAIGHFDRAIEVLESGAPGAAVAARAYEGRGLALELVGDVMAASANFEAMRAYAREHQDGTMEVSALNKLGHLHANYLGDVAGSTAFLNQAEELAEKEQCRTGLAESCMIRCVVHTVQAQFDEAYAFLDRAVRLGTDLEAEEPVLYGKTHIANTLVLMTEFDRAKDAIEETLRVAADFGNLKYQAELQALALPLVHMRDGDMDAATAAARDGLELAERIGSAEFTCKATVILGKIASLQGRLEESVAMNEKAVAAGRASGIPYLLGLALCTLGTSYLDVSERLQERTIAVHQEAMDVMERPGGGAFAAMNWCELGMCALRMGRLDEAAEIFRIALETSSAPMYLVRPDLYLGAAMVAMQKGAMERAREQARSARDFAEERAMRQYTPFLDLLDGYLHLGDGQHDDALAAFHASADAADRLAFRPTLWTACAAAAGILDNRGDRDGAAACRDRGRAAVDEIAATFQDAAMREAYVQGAWRELGAEA